MSPTTAPGPTHVGTDPDKQQQDLISRDFLRVLAVWSVVPLYALAGAFFGWLIDSWLGTSPYALGVCLLIALAMGVRDMLRLRDTL